MVALFLTIIIVTLTLVLLELAAGHYYFVEMDKGLMKQKTSIFKRKFQEKSLAPDLLAMGEKKALERFTGQVNRYHRNLRRWKYAFVLLSLIFFVCVITFLDSEAAEPLYTIVSFGWFMAGVFLLSLVDVLLYLKITESVKQRYRESGFEEYMLRASPW